MGAVDLKEPWFTIPDGQAKKVRAHGGFTNKLDGVDQTLGSRPNIETRNDAYNERPCVSLFAHPNNAVLLFSSVPPFARRNTFCTRILRNTQPPPFSPHLA